MSLVVQVGMKAKNEGRCHPSLSPNDPPSLKTPRRLSGNLQDSFSYQVTVSNGQATDPKKPPIFP